jgi:hypothetical protein
MAFTQFTLPVSQAGNLQSYREVRDKLKTEAKAFETNPLADEPLQGSGLHSCLQMLLDLFSSAIT